MLPTRLAISAILFGLATIGVLATRAWARESRRDEERASGASQRPLRPANSDAPLPEGLPDATPPGKIEIKNYPAYRSAMAMARGVTLRSDAGLFSSLFDHISKSKIEMMAPVVKTYMAPAMIDTPPAKGDMTMEFLYRDTRQGRTGNGVGSVVVVDHPAQRFVCLGLVGKMDDSVLRDGVNRLRAWLDQPENKQKWVEAGPTRRLGYHGPMTPSSDRRWEIQIPIEPVAAAKDAGSSHPGRYGVATGPVPGR